MSTLWIVHRSQGHRSALARTLTGVAELELGGPAPEDFEARPAPGAVLLGVSDDFDLELHFTDRFVARHPDSAWIIVVAADDLPEARRLFAGLGAAFAPYPSEARELRPLVRAALRRRAVDTLVDRARRRAVWERFDRWFADLRERLPALLQATDPEREGVPILVRGEPGTGRGLLARYVHHHYLHDAGRAAGAVAGGTFARIVCRDLEPDALRAALRARAASGPTHEKLTVCLEELDRLPPAAQRDLRDWVETGLPGRLPGSPLRLRWIGLASDMDAAVAPGLDSSLAQVLSGITIRIPPLRERREFIPAFARATAAAWCQERRQRRSFRADALDALAQQEWPGNLRELEAAVVRTLASTEALEISAPDLRLDGALCPSEAAPPGARAPELDEMASELEEAVAAATAGAEPPAAAEPEPGLPEAAEIESEQPLAAEPEPTASPAERGLSGESARRLLHAIAHEVRNPLVSIRTLADLLPERHDDSAFRSRFVGLVSDDVRRIEHVVEQLAQLAELSAPARDRVDMSDLIEQLLDAERERIQARRLVVLQELDRSRGVCLGDAAQLRLALGALIGKAIDLVPDRGDVYVSSRHQTRGLDGGPSLRVLVRFHTPEPVVPVEPVEPGEALGVSIAQTALDFILAEAVLRAGGGRFEISREGARETVVTVSLPAPA